jgi:hypothetical protein
MSRWRFALMSIGLPGGFLLALFLGILVALKLMGPQLPIFKYRAMLMLTAGAFTTIASLFTGVLVTGLDEWLGYGEILRSGSKVLKNILVPRLLAWFAFTVFTASVISGMLERFSPRLEGVQAAIGALTCATIFGLCAAALTSAARDPWLGGIGALLLFGFSMNTRGSTYTVKELANPVNLLRRYANQVDDWALAVHLSFLLLVCSALVWLILRHHARPER